jgi:hypothetical protein
MLTSSVVLVHDRACLQTAACTQALLEHFNWESFGLRSRKLRLMPVGDPPRRQRNTPLSAKVNTKFRRQVAVTQIVRSRTKGHEVCSFCHLATLLTALISLWVTTTCYLPEELVRIRTLQQYWEVSGRCGRLKNVSDLVGPGCLLLKHAEAYSPIWWVPQFWCWLHWELF